MTQLQAAGIAVETDPQLYPNGRFARLHDLEGDPVELSEPAGRDACRWFKLPQLWRNTIIHFEGHKDLSPINKFSKRPEQIDVLLPNAGNVTARRLAGRDSKAAQWCRAIL